MIQVINADGFSVEIHDNVRKGVCKVVDVRAEAPRQDQEQIDHVIQGNVGDN